MKKRILIVASVFPPDAVTSAYLNVDQANALAEYFDVTVLRPFPSRPKGVKYTEDDIKKYDSFRTILVDSYIYPSSNPTGRFRESVSFGKACKKYIEEHADEIDFVYNHSWHLFGYYIVAKACVRYGIPFMVPVQDIYPESLFTNRTLPKFIQSIVAWVLGKMDCYTLRHAAMVRTISEEMKLYLIKTRGLSENKVFAVDNWQDDANHVYRPYKLKNTFLFEYVGSINSHSNVDLIIRAFAKADLPNAKLKIYGGGNKKDECVALAKDLHLDNVEFDFVSRDNVPDVQADADVLVLALSKGNATFSLPSKVTSYMLSGRPIIASVDEDSATTRYIKESACGIAVDAANVNLLAKAFKEITQYSPEKMLKMGEMARRFAENRLSRAYNLNIVVDKVKEILK